MIACCGTSVSKNEGQASLERLRKNNGHDINLKLNEFNMQYDSKNGMWKSNLHHFEIDDPNEPEMKEKYNIIQKENEDLDTELINLEKEYQSKLAELLIATKVHCQVKSELQDLFDELEVAHQDFDIIKQYQILNQYFLFHLSIFQSNLLMLNINSK